MEKYTIWGQIKTKCCILNSEEEQQNANGTSQTRQPSGTTISRYYKSKLKIQDLNNCLICVFSSVSLDNNTSEGFNYNPEIVNQLSLVLDPFRAANVDGELTEPPPLSPPNQSRSGYETGSKKRKLNLDASKVSTEKKTNLNNLSIMRWICDWVENLSYKCIFLSYYFVNRTRGTQKEPKKH